MLIKRIAQFGIFIMLLIVITGCSRTTGTTDENESFVLPEPPKQDEQMFLGEHWTDYDEPITYYYVSSDRASFTPISKSLSRSEYSGDIASLIIEDLLSYAVSNDGLFSGTGSNIYLLDTEISNSSITVDLSIDSYLVNDEQSFFALLASVTNTLVSLDSFDAVNILVDHGAVSIDGMPVGTRTVPYSGVMPAYAQFSAEREFFIDSVSGTIQRSAILYFPSNSGNGFIPVLREMDLDSDDYASALIRELRYLPEDDLYLSAVLPEDEDYLVNNPYYRMTEDGKRILHLDLSEGILDHVALSDLTEAELYGSIILTLTSFVPDIDAVEIQLGDSIVKELDVFGDVLTLENGYMDRSCFEKYINSLNYLYIPNSSQGLDAEFFPVPVYASHSLTTVLSPLMLRLNEAGSRMGCSGSIDSTDLLGVLVNDETAYLNFSANFYRYVQQLDDDQEKQFVFSIVNTVCSRNDISSVHILIEGNAAEFFSGSLYMRGELLPNEGLAFLYK